MKENQAVTHGIANKGFSGMRRVVARFNFTCNLTGNHPQSLTGHTAIRYASDKKRYNESKDSKNIGQSYNQILNSRNLNNYSIWEF